MALALMGLSAAGGSSARADEFLLKDASGNSLRYVQVQLTQNGRWVSTMFTDKLGRLVVPYRGTAATYVVERGSANATLDVNGARSLKVKTLR